MSLRTRLVIFVLLFGSAVLTNLFALVYLARSISRSLDAIERIRQRQLVTVQMNAHLRDAEAALYRYQINGEAGFKFQFAEQLKHFSDDLEQYRQLATDESEQQWIAALDAAYEQASTTGNNLIELRDQQTSSMEDFLDTQSQLSEFLLNEVSIHHPDDAEYQAVVTEMQDASRAMLYAVTGYLASPDETRRVQFTDAVVSFQGGVNHFRDIAQSVEEKRWAEESLTQFDQLKSLGTQLIGGRDLQQSLYANFISMIFNASQQVIVGQIEPHETERFAQEQQSLLTAVGTASFLSILAAVIISIFAILFMYRLSHQINTRAAALLEGAERVTLGDLKQPVVIDGRDEFGRLAESFNEMMRELASREERLRTLIGRMSQIQDEERRLIGLDLHDGLTQLVISANMHLNALNALASFKLEPEALQELDVSRSLVKQSIEEARKVIAELRPNVIEDFGLEEGLRRYASEICEAHHWMYEIDIETDGLQIAPSIQTAIFRIAQEALSNVSKHAQTQKVRIELSANGQGLLLRVQDWGRGFDPTVSGQELNHLGLVSIQERAGLVGGVCRIQSKQGEGTLVEVEIPRAALTERRSNGER